MVVGISYEKHHDDSYGASINMPAEQIDLYWDTSASFGEYNQDDKISFLKSYLSKFEQLDVVLHSFSSQTKVEGLFKIKNGNSEELIRAIQALKYDGSSRLTIEKSDRMVLIVTDGNFQNLIAHPKTMGYVIIANGQNALPDTHYGNLLPLKIEEITPSNVGNLRIIGNDHAFMFEGSKRSSSVKTNQADDIKGIVKLKGLTALQNASISLKNSFNKVYTDNVGRFQISAGIGDTLSISHISAKDKTVVIENDALKYIELLPKYEILDSVKLSPVKSKEVIYKDKWGRKRNKNSLGASIYTLDKKDFPKSALSFRELIMYKFPSLEVDPKRNGPIFSRRAKTFSVGVDLWVPIIVDGMPVENPDDLDIRTFSKIHFLPSLSQTAIYGSRGAAGVILIETEPSYFKTDREVNILKERDNYTDEVLSKINPKSLKSKFYGFFKELDTVKHALKNYESHKIQNKYSVQYYVDIFYAIKELDSEFAFSVLSNLYELGYNNPSVLKIYAYVLDENKRHQLALEVYNHILKLRPNQSQSHLDYANALVNAGQIDEAANYYGFLLKHLGPSVDSESFKKIADMSYRRLLTKYRSRVTKRRVDSRYLEKAYVQDVVVLLEWSDPNMEFELEFVNPDGRYYRSGNNAMGSNDFKTDFEAGQFSKTFELDDSEKGVWSLNISCDQTVDRVKATFLKYTRYENYGAHDEKKTIELIPTHMIKGKFNLDTYRIQ